MTAIHQRVERLRDGLDPTLIVRMDSGWAVFGESQFLRGYSLLLPDPVVAHLNDFAPGARSVFLADMARLGDALLQATGALRINYAMFGNQEPALHAHLVPRYADEAPAMASAHPWAYDWQQAPRFEPATYQSLRTRILQALSADQSA